MNTLKTLLLAAVFCITAIASTVSAQTYKFQVPTSCGAFVANYTCTLQIVEPSGNVKFFYEPRWNTQLGYVQFADLGRATVTEANTVHVSHVDNGKKNGNTFLQGYIGMDSYTETTKFQGGGFTGSTDTSFTTTTQCCSSGRGPSQHTVWDITSGTVTINQ